MYEKWEHWEKFCSPENFSFNFVSSECCKFSLSTKFAVDVLGFNVVSLDLLASHWIQLNFVVLLVAVVTVVAVAVVVVIVVVVVVNVDGAAVVVDTVFTGHMLVVEVLVSSSFHRNVDINVVISSWKTNFVVKICEINAAAQTLQNCHKLSRIFHNIIKIIVKCFGKL